MHKQIFTILMCLCGVFISNINAQSVIQIPFKQSPALTVSAESVYVGFIEGGVELGATIIINGGSGEYTYLWTLNGQTLGTSSTLFAEEMGEYFLVITDEKDCSKSVKFIVSDGTDISTVKEIGIAVYPNPTHGDVYMESSVCDQVKQISVVSAESKLVRVYNQITLLEENRISINLSDLPKGNYIITYLIGKEIITKQVILL